MSTKPIIGPAAGYGFIEGTAGDDFIVALGPYNTIYSEGGADFINAGNGGGTVILGGSNLPNVAPVGTTTVNLQGTGNVVQTFEGGQTGIILNGPGPYDGSSPVYSGAVSIVGYAGRNTVALGEGDATLDLGGYGNKVLIGGGTSTIRLPGGGPIPPGGLPTAGYNFVTVGGAPDGPEINDTVLLAGLSNHVSNISNTQPSPSGEIERAGTLSIIGGAGNGSFSTDGADTTLRTTGTGNLVNVGLTGTSIIAPGDGDDTVVFGVDAYSRQPALASATVTLKGQYNTVSGLAQSLAITGGDGHGSYILSGIAFPIAISEYGVIIPGTSLYAFFDRTYSVTAGGLFNSFTLDDTNNNTITTGAGYATVTLLHPMLPSLGSAAADAQGLPTKLATITLPGNYNTLTAADGPTKVYATGFGDTITLGNGDNQVTSVGFKGRPAGNTITLGSGHDNQVAAAGGDTLRLNGGNDFISFSSRGPQSMIFLGGGVHATVNAYASDVSLDVLAGNINVTLKQPYSVATPTIGTVVLEQGTVTASTAAQVLASLHSDGHGGTALSLAGGGVLDFSATAASAFSAANFILRS